MEDEQKYANLHGWTDVQPFEIIARTKKTITVRSMNATLDPSWKPNTLIGGFAGHTVNNRDQKWIITSDENGIIVKAYLRKDGHYYSKFGKHKLYKDPIKFYDYNF